MNATETTPLLSRLNSSPGHAGGSPFPTIKPAVSRIEEGEILSLQISDLFSDSFSSKESETAYASIILLELLCRTNRSPLRSNNLEHAELGDFPSDARSRHLEQMFLLIWEQYLRDHPSPEYVEDVLWHEFPTEEISLVTIRVIDCLANYPDIPDAITSHPIICSSILRTWQYGRHGHISPGLGTGLRILHLFDSLCTPRALHGLDMICNVVNVAVLVHFVLYPPSKPIITQGLTTCGSRGILLIVYSITSIAKWSHDAIPSLLVLISFAACLPLPPLPGDTPFDVLLFSLALHIIRLHCPQAPSPLLLLPVQQTLPFSIFIRESILKIISPVFLFFLPVLAISTFLLSISLADGVNPVLTNIIVLGPSPMQTRSALLTFIIVELIFILWAIFIFSLTFPSLLSAPRSISIWDRYSVHVGISARKTFARVVLAYEKHYFPAPFNAAQIALIFLPSIFLQLVGKKSRPSYLVVLQGVLWRVFVGPFALSIAGLWLWNVRKQRL